jgi:hypothetical protein
MCEDNFDQEHVGNGITNSLVDEVGDCLKRVEGVVLSGRLRFMCFDDRLGMWGKENCSVTVRFKINSTIESLGLMVEIFDTGHRAGHWDFLRKLAMEGGLPRHWSSRTWNFRSHKRFERRLL